LQGFLILGWDLSLIREVDGKDLQVVGSIPRIAFLGGKLEGSEKGRDYWAWKRSIKTAHPPTSKPGIISNRGGLGPLFREERTDTEEKTKF